MRAAVFPGQGSQAVGMGKALAEAYPAAAQVFEAVDDALGEKLSTLIWEGPEETLRLTENAQPALMAVSLAAVAALSAEGATIDKVADYAAGHSLGEYSALAAIGALDLADAAKLLRIRGRAMQEATPVGVGAMAALLGLELEDAEAAAAEAAGDQVCEAANDNAPGQVVISGHKEAVERAIEIAKSKGAKRAMALPVSAPFHCALMQPAADRMREALAGTTINRPTLPLVANVKASETREPEEIRQLLIDQVTGRVRWRESVLWMRSAGVEELIEIGAGKVLAGMAKRIDKGLGARAVGAPDDVKALAAELNA